MIITQVTFFTFSSTIMILFFNHAITLTWPWDQYRSDTSKSCSPHQFIFFLELYIYWTVLQSHKLPKIEQTCVAILWSPNLKYFIIIVICFGHEYFQKCERIDLYSWNSSRFISVTKKIAIDLVMFESN